MMNQPAKARQRRGSGGQSKPRVVVIEDHPMMRRAIVDTLTTQLDFEVCGEADREPTALRLIDKTQPDLALIDLTLEEGHGLDLIKRLKAVSPDTKVMVYSMHDDDLYAERVIRAGASGFVNKSASAQVFREAIERILAGGVHVSERVATRLIGRLCGDTERSEGDKPASDIMQQLSDRELETFELIGRGKNTREIAEQMNLSPKTIDVYRQRIKQKLSIDNNNELVRRAVEYGLRL